MNDWKHEQGLSSELVTECLSRDGISQRSISYIQQRYISATTSYYKYEPIGFSYVVPMIDNGEEVLIFGGSGHLHPLPFRYAMALENCRQTIARVSRETLYAFVERKNINVLLTLEQLGFKIMRQTEKDHELLLIREPDHG